MPEDFLNEFDQTIQHGTYDKTRSLIDKRLKRCNYIQQLLSEENINVNQLDPQKLIDFYAIKNAEAELLVETGGIEESIDLAQTYIDQLNDLIDTLENEATNDSDKVLIDYLKFGKTEFMRTLMDANRRLGNLEQIDLLLKNIDKILDYLCIPQDTPRYIKSQAYNRNFRAIQKWNYGKPDEAKSLFQQCIDDFKSLNAPADVAMIHNNLGLTYLMRSKFHDAIFYFKQSLDYFEDKPNTALIAGLLNNIGEAYREIGDIPQALSYHKETLKLRLSIGHEEEIGQSYLFLGSLYMDQGRLDEALSNFTQSLEIYKKINHELNIARLLFKIGEVYLDRGQFHQAEAYYQKSITYVEQSSNPVILADSYQSIGIIQREKGDYDSAITRFQQSADLREDVGNQALLAISQSEMVECHVLQNEMKRASELLEMIGQVVVDHPEHKILNIYYQLVRGIYNQHSIRARDKIEAENQYREILDLPVIPYKLAVRTTKQLIKLLLEELQHYGEDVVLLEIVEYLDKLESLAKQQSLLLVLAEVYLIRHQLQLLLGKSEVSKQYLDKATVIIETLDVPILSQKLDQVVTFYDRNMELWEDLDKLNLALSDRLKLSIISSSLQNSRSLLDLYQNETGRTILVMVFSESGTIAFSYVFNAFREESNNLNPHLIASFMSALNSFGRDTFNTSELLETLTYGHHKLISRKIGKHIISLLYEGTNLHVHQQLIDFELFMKKSGFFKFIERYPKQEFMLDDQQVDIIESIFN